jgi:hypothetical protein
MANLNLTRFPLNPSVKAAKPVDFKRNKLLLNLSPKALLTCPTHLN